MLVQKVVAHITSWLDSPVEKSATKGFVMGLSVGMDSTVSPTSGVRIDSPLLWDEMPIQQSPNQVTRARLHLEALKTCYPNIRSVGLWSDDATDNDRIGSTCPGPEWALDFTAEDSTPRRGSVRSSRSIEGCLAPIGSRWSRSPYV